jgi:hypothetical protein
MSFRYTNFLTGMFTQRILLHRALTAVATRKYVGRAQGVVATTTAAGRVLSIAVDSSARADFVDAATGVVRAAPLAQAIRAALFDATVKVRRDKEEAFRESLRGSTHTMRNEHYALWYSANGASLPPFAYDSMADEPFVEALEAGASAQSASGAPASVFGEYRAAANDSMAACVPELAGALMQLEDPIVVAEKHRMRVDDAESAFWQRVDLIRRAQVNTIGTRKRRYEEFEVATAKADDIVDKTKLFFVR